MLKRNHIASTATLLILCATSSVVLMPTASSQDLDRYHPAPPITRPALPQIPPPVIQSTDGSTDIIVDRLRGLLILDDEERIQSLITPFDGIRIDPAADLTFAREQEFEHALQPYLGQAVSMQNLNQLAQHIVRLYRNAGHPVVDVAIPPGQEITQGMIQVVITEGRIGKIRFQGNCWFDSCLLQQESWLRPGQEIRQANLYEELAWFNLNPFRDVFVNFEPGHQPGTTDIVYQVHDERPIQGFIGYDDTGVRQLGRERARVGFVWGNAFQRDHILSYQYLTNADFGNDLSVHSLSYEIPIFENRDSVALIASVSDIDSGVINPAQIHAEAWQISGRYRHVLCDSGCQLDEFHFGFDTKGTSSDLDFGGVTVLENTVDVVNFTAGISSVQNYPDGQTAYGLDAFLSPGGLLGRNNDSDFSQLRAQTDATYLYARGYVEKLFQIDSDRQFFVRATGQLSSDRLLQTEQLGFGGFHSVRGYDARTVNGDSGYIVNFEYRTSPIIGCCGNDTSSLTLHAFTDVAQQFNWRPVPGELSGEFLSSVGVGFRYVLDPSCTIRFDYGLPLSSVGNVDINRGGRIHLGITLGY